MKYPANIYVIEALQLAIKELQANIRSNGECAHHEFKVSQSAKEYFEGCIKERIAAIEEIKTFIKQVKQDD